MGDELIIRPMVSADLEAIRDITWRGWDDVTWWELLERRHGPWTAKSWRDRKAESVVAQCSSAPDTVLVAELGGRVVGYATFHYTPEDRLGEVGNNCVDPQFRGRGIGTRLIAAVLQKLRELGAKVVTVTTMERDLPARRVYEKNGFVELGKSLVYSLQFD
jgi:RimJ/RimL family protein N-acetyltransferase